MKKARGSALIIAMLMIASIGSIAFGIARIIFLESNITALHENSVQAYYAAESGIEEGFLRYRYNRSAEVPFKGWDPDIKNVFRTNLALMTTITGTDYEGILPSPLSDTFDKSEQSYDLRMGYLGTSGTATYTDSPLGIGWDHTKILQPDFGTGKNSFLKIGKDENYKFDLTNFNFNEGFSVGIKAVGMGDGNGYLNQEEICHAMTEIKFVVKNDDDSTGEFKAITSPDPAACTGYSMGGSVAYAGSPSLSVGNASDNSYYYRLDDIIRTLLASSGKTIPAGGKYKRAELQVKPFYSDAMVMFGATTCTVGSSCTLDKTVTGPYTSMTSVGYYGGITRTLSANIDRQSGTLYDLFDYVIYNNGG